MSSLTPVDTYLAPADVIPQLLGMISPWIDLCSPDPIVYQISRQVLDMEVAYAAFCGLNALVLPVPRLHHGTEHGYGVSQYAYSVQEALRIGGFIHFSVTIPMMDNPSDSFEGHASLASLARPEFVDTLEDQRRSSIDHNRKHDFFGTWDAWNVIRTVTNYHARLFVGKENVKISMFPLIIAQIPNQKYVTPRMEMYA